MLLRLILDFQSYGQKFTTRNAMPDGFTPVDFDITYDCGDTSKIKNSLQMRNPTVQLG